jgi:translocation and assembly module TamA
LAVAFFSSWAFGADPQPYKVELASVGDGDMDSTLKATSDLQNLRSSAPVSPFGLIARARSDMDRLKTVLESYGYYEASVRIKINGLALTDPSLGDQLTAAPAGNDAKVNVEFTLATRYTLRNIDVEGEIPADLDARSILDLKSGQPAAAESVLAGGTRLLTALRERGYALAKVDTPVAYQAADAAVLDVSFHVSTGPKVKIGEIRLRGLKRVHETLLRRRLLLHTGDPYRPSVIERARRDLLSLNVFSQINVDLGDKPDATGGLPVTFRLRERLRHAVAFNTAYSTDLGGSGGATWTDRNVFGNAENLSVAARVINLGGSESDGIGYDATVKYLTPEFLRRDQSLQITIEALKQPLLAYDQTSRMFGVTLARKLSSLWSVNAGVALTYETIIQPPTGTNAQLLVDNGATTGPPSCQGVPVPPCTSSFPSITYNYTLVALPFTANYDSTHLSSALEDPTHGYRASATLTPTLAVGRTNSVFVISQIRAAGFFDVGSWLGESSGRSIVAVRGLAGLAQGAGEFGLPPDQRFYGGGSTTIRGYQYQTVGPKLETADHKNVYPLGGTAISAGSVEWRQRFGRNWGAAFFVDGGQVSNTFKLLPDNFNVGVGAGARYYTGIGPIRFDVAVPTHHEMGTDHFEIYIGLGQAF